MQNAGPQRARLRFRDSHTSSIDIKHRLERFQLKVDDVPAFLGVPMLDFHEAIFGELLQLLIFYGATDRRNAVQPRRQCKFVRQFATGHRIEELADFVVESRWEDIPAGVRHETKRSLLNFFGTALGGCRDEAIEIARAVLPALSDSRQATIIGYHEQTDILNAAFLNAASANVFDFDDTHLPTIMHPTAPVAPALFALAERRRMSGTELLHAFVLGVEVECQIGNSISPGHYNKGWHIMATCGVFGAAAAAGKQLGLDAQQIVYAFGSGAFARRIDTAPKKCSAFLTKKRSLDGSVCAVRCGRSRATQDVLHQSSAGKSNAMVAWLVDICTNISWFSPSCVYSKGRYWRRLT